MQLIISSVLSTYYSIIVLYLLRIQKLILISASALRNE